MGSRLVAFGVFASLAYDYKKVILHVHKKRDNPACPRYYVDITYKYDLVLRVWPSGGSIFQSLYNCIKNADCIRDIEFLILQPDREAAS